jgi:DNA polymerase-4
MRVREEIQYPHRDDQWLGPAILHVDLDAFFAAVEQLDHPEWRGKPVIVGGSAEGRGVVSTCSYEARVFGVRSAMPSVRARQLCPEAIWARGNFARYREMSQAVFAILREESPLVQPVSIDEAYLDITPGRYADDDPVDIARRIRSRIATLGITASAGLSSSKCVSKIASDFDKPDGLTVVRPGEEAAFLAPLPVRSMPGVGQRTAERLTSLGVATLGALASLDDATASEVLGRHGPDMVRRASGMDVRPVHDNDPVKSVSNERTFAADVRTRSEIDDAIAKLAAKVALRLRKKGAAGRTVTIKVRFSDFTTKTVRRTLAAPTDDDLVIAEVSRELLGGVWSPGVGLRLLGVGMSGFDERALQLDLLSEDAEVTPRDGAPERRGGRDRLVRGMDAVREKFGDDAVKFGRDLRTAKRENDEEN